LQLILDNQHNNNKLKAQEYCTFVKCGFFGKISHRESGKEVEIVEAWALRAVNIDKNMKQVN